MTVLVAVALVFAPHLEPVQETPQWQPSNPSVSVAVSVPATFMSTMTTSDVGIESLVPTELPWHETEPVPTVQETIHQPIEWALNRLAELGASPYELRTFGCLAWAESRNDPRAVSRTNDHGIFQISAIHRWRWETLDIYDPVVNAQIAWSIYKESGWRAWTTHWSCGV